MEKIIVQFNIPGMTSEQFDKIWEDLRAAGHANPIGLIHHVGAATDRGFLVVDVWESADKFNEFGSTLMPILAKNGFQDLESVILPLHYMYSSNLVH